MKKNRKGGPPKKASCYAGAVRSLPILGLSWVGSLLLAAPASLCPSFTAYYAAYLAATLGLAAGALAFLYAIYRKGRIALHPAFKKFLGYGLVLHYAAASLPRVDWAESGLISAGRVAYLFVLSMICLAAGLACFVASGRPAAYAGLGLIEDREVRDAALRKKRRAERKAKGLIRGTLDWIDALGFAAILVILLQTFIFQLYEIPSESMVPAFLKKDRPFMSKLDAGPVLPLTDWRLPILRLPKRGDVVTLSNPRYPENQGVNLRKYLSRFVSMLTFTIVNIDKYLPDGSIKNDPLVKRIVGLPGEKLMMVDDVLYSKRRGDVDFMPVAEDIAWASIDLWKLDPEKKSHIDVLPIDEKHRAILRAWDERKRSADPAALSASIAASARLIASKASAAKADAFIKELERMRPDAYRGIADSRLSFEKGDGVGGNPLAAAGTRANDLAIALAVGPSPKVRVALAEYAAVGGALVPAADAYTRGGRMLNLLIKDNFLARVAREEGLIANGVSIDELSKDADLGALNSEGSELDYYVNGPYAGYDARNFPEFPAGDSYLGPEQYFAMGDNRYNSMDFRYRSSEVKNKPLDPADPASVMYGSFVDPFALDLRFIEGYALFRVWPPSRIGAIR